MQISLWKILLILLSQETQKHILVVKQKRIWILFSRISDVNLKGTECGIIRQGCRNYKHDFMYTLNQASLKRWMLVVHAVIFYWFITFYIAIAILSFHSSSPFFSWEPLKINIQNVRLKNHRDPRTKHRFKRSGRGWQADFHHRKHFLPLLKIFNLQ